MGGASAADAAGAGREGMQFCLGRLKLERTSSRGSASTVVRSPSPAPSSHHRLSACVHTMPPGASARCIASKKGCRHRGGGGGRERMHQ